MNSSFLQSYERLVCLSVLRGITLRRKLRIVPSRAVKERPGRYYDIQYT